MNNLSHGAAPDFIVERTCPPNVRFDSHLCRVPCETPNNRVGVKVLKTRKNDDPLSQVLPVIKHFDKGLPARIPRVFLAEETTK